MSQDTKDVKMLTQWQYDDSSAAWSPDGQKLGWRRTLTDKNDKRNFEFSAKDLKTGDKINLSNSAALILIRTGLQPVILLYLLRTETSLSVG